jgi:calcineurin-like phosphoesterase family protein
MSARILVISDTHFGHENIYSFVDSQGRRIRHEFKNSFEGDYEMVRRWKSVVRPDDHVYHLGDYAMNHTKYLYLLRELPGHKRLILGNHDHWRVRDYMEAGFEKVYSSRLIGQYLLTHIPVQIILWTYGIAIVGFFVYFVPWLILFLLCFALVVKAGTWAIDTLMDQDPTKIDPVC